MTIRTFRRARGLAAAVLLALAGGAPGLAQTSAPPIDQGVRYTFREPPFQGRGVRTLEELRGRPVLIEYWSPICPPCVSSGVPLAVRLRQVHGDGLHVILSAALGSEGQALSFAMNQGWMRTPVMWTTEVPVRGELSLLPWAVLISAEGDVVLEGDPNELRTRLDDEVANQIRQAARGPSELPRDLSRALVESNEGHFARARDIVMKELAAAEDGRKAEARRVLVTIEERLAQRIAQARWMLENGYPIDAAEALDKLAKGLEGWEEKSAEVAVLAAELETDAMKVEIEAQKALSKIEKRLFEDPSVRWVKQLQGIVEKYPRTKCAERAKKLAKIAAI